jgi:hypothetical protein
MTIVTIRGQKGTDASELGRAVAKSLDADYVDRQIIAEVAERLKRKEDDIEAKEMPPSSLWGRIEEALDKAGTYGFGEAFPGAYMPVWEIPLNNDLYAQALEIVVKEIVRKGPIVIHGRGSQFILRDVPEAFHVLLIADLNIRIGRLMKGSGLTEEDAREEIRRFDASRNEFVRRYFKADLEDPVHYDLVVNVGRLRSTDAVRLIVEGVLAKKESLGA